ncbi:hypothetical protein EJ04DRAFT_579659 [Polyplosphaeria fusca]|uniref:DUF7357 domain-containing protein n=1 Tax=Polyplosphaeria fusca TaxID=682080 RepID=A0A9P4QTL7_9PLEO|nr:hypothetical protein EJ04DRAFT_579659 [Polyplosphaeria fusca]
MRLRLSVQRHGLPAVNLVWPVPDTNSPQAYTIARLLEDVNKIFPLEAEQWGLEDYTVELDGFECLHFTPVFQALKENDQLTIRPLLTAEVRARTLSGRYQINEGGQHLVDGVPFGRPYLRAPNRPAVAIPSRKRRRLDDDTGKEHSEQTTVNVSSPATTAKSVRFEQPQIEYPGHLDGDASENESEDDDFDLAESETSDTSSSDESDSDTDTEASSSELSDSQTKYDNQSKSDSDSSSDTSSDSDSDSSSASEDSGPTYEPITKNRNSETQRRNQRRKNALHLKKLKESGDLEANATLQDLKAWRDKGSKQNPQDNDYQGDRHGPNTTATVKKTRSTVPNLHAFKRILETQATRPGMIRTRNRKQQEAPVDPEPPKRNCKVSAYECIHEDITLKAPPFPFKQHWDKEAIEKMHQLEEEDRSKKGSRKNKRLRMEQNPAELDAVMLDYGDAEVENQLLQEIQTAVTADLPTLPDDVESLASIDAADIKVGAIIVFKEMAMDPISFAPAVSTFKTAAIESVEAGHELGLRLAKRDVVHKEKKYDKKGNRVYDKVDKLMMDESDEEGDGLHWAYLHELLDVKLLQAA